MTSWKLSDWNSSFDNILWLRADYHFTYYFTISLLCVFFHFQTTLFYSSYVVGNNEKYFKEPQTFDPDRWERDDIHPFSILPFGVGPRGCWGKFISF